MLATKARTITRHGYAMTAVERVVPSFNEGDLIMAPSPGAHVQNIAGRNNRLVGMSATLPALTIDLPAVFAS